MQTLYRKSQIDLQSLSWRLWISSTKWNVEEKCPVPASRHPTWISYDFFFFFFFFFFHHWQGQISKVAPTSEALNESGVGSDKATLPQTRRVSRCILSSSSNHGSASGTQLWHFTDCVQNYLNFVMLLVKGDGATLFFYIQYVCAFAYF